MNKGIVDRIEGIIIRPTVADNFREVARQLNKIFNRLDIIEQNVIIEVDEEALKGKMSLYEYNKHKSNAI
jgi:hypothetical protein